MAAQKSSEEDAGAEFFEQSCFTYIVPSATEFVPEQALSGPGIISEQSPVDAVEQRQWLFFDETVDVYFVLRTPHVDGQILRSYLKRLSISLEVQIVNNHLSERDSPPPSEVIYSGAVEAIEDAEVVVLGGAEQVEEHEGHDGVQRLAYAVWKLPVFLARPRIRLQAPSVIFYGSASFRAADAAGVIGEKDGYLQSLAPAGMNLLEAFASDPAFRGVKPRLSALRVSRVAPVTHMNEHMRPVRGLQGFKRRIYPALHARLRFSRPNTTPPSLALIVLLELDFTPFFDYIVSRDLTRDLDTALEVMALIQPHGPNRCVPRLKMAWTTAVDFTLPLNPGFGQPVSQPIQRAHRPSQLSIGAGLDTQSLLAPSLTRPDAHPSSDSASVRGMDTNLSGFGVTITITGPNEPVLAGEEFTWTVFIVNRGKSEGHRPQTSSGLSVSSIMSQATATGARKLALLTIPKRRRNELRVLRPPSNGGPDARHDPLVADAVLDENVVHVMQRSSIVDTTDVVCLSADVRVGPLAPNACAVVELRFLALRAGVVGIEAVRIIDMSSQEHVDVRELPSVVVRERQEL
ncbi:hypothetical protein P8C59_007313 [Phyllachora maydis]|uniref:Trafficking protein particle complex II-specific subunit 65 IgD3 domain-containing protein n=1 Tax=Phyllachora maydis TaxID=1825666 RepID=A0AAD9I8A5_9PEZI|nr:hypothetical protein P8C59_007313 [Phyllachora maydis]